MDKILARVMPRRWWHWPVSVMFWGAVAAVFAHGVDLVLYGQPRQSFISNLRETVLTAAPLVVFALLLVRHAHNLHQDAMRMALTDPLTGLLNRRAFLSALAQQRSGLLFMLDLDHFKQVNENYGHEAGDHILKLLTLYMRKHLGTGLLSRLGGEEFAILMAGDDNDQLHVKLDDFRRDIAVSAMQYQDHQISTSISIGVCFSDSGDLGHHIQLADKALFAAKENGRNQIVVSGEEEHH